MSDLHTIFIFYMSTILYHIRNLDSVVDDKESVHYNYVNIVLEEVELYFHPEYQRKFIDKLISYLKRSHFDRIEHFNIMIVTHSPFILSDIPRDNVLFLNEGLSYNAYEICDSNTFGANIHDLLRTSFFLKNGLLGEFANKKIAELLILLQGDNNKELYDVGYKNIVELRKELERKRDEINVRLNRLNNETNLHRR